LCEHAYGSSPLKAAPLLASCADLAPPPRALACASLYHLLIVRLSLRPWDHLPPEICSTMEADGVALSLRSRSVVGVEKIGVGSGVTSRRSLRVQAPWRWAAAGGRPSLGCVRMDSLGRDLVARNGRSSLKVVCSYKKAEAPAIQSEKFNATADEALILKKMAEEVAPHLNGQCIFLVGLFPIFKLR
ncbi:hypothetical protein Taro_042158, partial [Colocasia esculenta]|nr:hypothetical protein [Colocasia esculenta]